MSNSPSGFTKLAASCQERCFSRLVSKTGSNRMSWPRQPPTTAFCSPSLTNSVAASPPDGRRTMPQRPL
eukprot:6471509-Amphidinium_carterae.1